jgi:three-Cys-motif partner protein
MFLEKDAAAFAKLKEFADEVADVQIEVRNSELTDALGDVLQFIKRGGRTSFPFVFIDPTGWTGFGMKLISSLLQLQPGEVLINFMTDYVRRFIDTPDQPTRQQFTDLFGSDDVQDRIRALAEPQDREDALIQTYAQNVKSMGNFAYACAATVLYPAIDRTYFHLIYATRNRKGVEVFKEVEQKAMGVMEQTRAEAKQRKRVNRSGQRELFSGQEMVPARPIDGLRARYLVQARKTVLELLQSNQQVPYETVWDQALSFPLVWDCDVKD